jgi:hypothetical protein
MQTGGHDKANCRSLQLCKRLKRLYIYRNRVTGEFTGILPTAKSSSVKYENIKNAVTYEIKLSIQGKIMQLTNCTPNVTNSSSEVCKRTTGQNILWILSATSNHHTTKIK